MQKSSAALPAGFKVIHTASELCRWRQQHYDRDLCVRKDQLVSVFCAVAVARNVQPGTRCPCGVQWFRARPTCPHHIECTCTAYYRCWRWLQEARSYRIQRRVRIAERLDLWVEAIVCRNLTPELVVQSPAHPAAKDSYLRNAFTHFTCATSRPTLTV